MCFKVPCKRSWKTWYAPKTRWNKSIFTVMSDISPQNLLKFHAVSLVGFVELHVSHYAIISFHKNKLRGLSPQANHTDRVTATCQPSYYQIMRIEDATWSEWRIPTAVFLLNCTHEIEWTPFPDPLLLRTFCYITYKFSSYLTGSTIHLCSAARNSDH
jgi:hypothetical protein